MTKPEKAALIFALSVICRVAVVASARWVQAA